MFVFWSRLLVVLLAGALALALPADADPNPGRIHPGDKVSMNRQLFDPQGPVSISPHVLLVLN